ncbi:hypothetical protein NUW54_g9486 [Trametes sanguinea]|uniref:Uncharacterized protein n=1 Tax=Trametes sanguinea TaxID=158606 RepID=A0ACC1P854_9APHY|nr:hypothetical protein NUW54_g9486 [Trametes sanguinea]
MPPPDRDPDITEFSPLPPSSPPLSPLSTIPSDDEREAEEVFRDAREELGIRVGEPTDAGFSSDHIYPTSPIRGSTHAQRSAARKAKVKKKRRTAEQARTAEKARAEQEEAEDARVSAEREEARKLQAEHEAATQKHARIRDVLAYMKTRDITYGDVLLFMSDTKASSGYGEERYRGLFSDRGRLRQILSNWVSSGQNKTTRTTVQAWALEYVASLVRKEGDAVTRAQTLQAFRRTVDASFVTEFKFTELYAQLFRLCPSMLSVVSAFCTTPRQTTKLTRMLSVGQLKEATKYQRQRNKVSKGSHFYWSPYRVTHLLLSQLIGSALTVLLRARSQRNSYAGQVMGLYLYATGASRQVISVLSHVGLSGSYQMLAGTHHRSEPRAGKTYPSTTLPQDSSSSTYGKLPTLNGKTSRLTLALE